MVITIDPPITTKTPEPAPSWLARISAPQNLTTGPILGFYTERLLRLPAPQEVKLSPEEEKLWQVAREFTDAIPGMRPRGEMGDLVSRGYLPTARARWYPEIMEVVVHEYMNKDGIKELALNGGYVDRGEFMHFYECRNLAERKNESDRWKELVDSKKPESGQWR